MSDAQRRARAVLRQIHDDSAVVSVSLLWMGIIAGIIIGAFFARGPW